MKMPPNKHKRKNAMTAKLKKIVEKPVMRRIGYDLPDDLIVEFKAATSMNETSMTAMIKHWATEYCNQVKKERGLDRLTK